MRRVIPTIGATFAALALLIAPLATPASASVEGPTWNHAYRQAPYVMVEDHTGYAWPVTAAVQHWAFGLHYGNCYNSQCVQVYEGNYGYNGRPASTTYTYYPSTNRFTSVRIYFNDAYAWLPYADRLQAVSQELGHALGLGHDGYADVMSPYICGCTYISGYERVELDYLYLR